MIRFGLSSDGQHRISISFMGVRSSLWFAFTIFIDGYGDDKGCARWSVIEKALLDLWDIRGRSIGNAIF